MRTNSWKSRILIAMLIILTAIALTLKVPMAEVHAAETGKVTITAKDSYEEAFEVLSLVNKERKSAGVSTLKMDKELLRAAMLRAHETSVYFSHTRPNGELCYTASEYIWGENIAAGYITAKSVVNGWMNSSGHRANILKESYTTIGIGVAIVDGQYYWVQCFGTELTESVSKSSYGNKNVTADISFEQSVVSPKLKYSPSTISSGKSVKALLHFNNGFCTTTGRPKGMAFQSSDETVCTVDGNGTVKGVNSGTAKISVLSSGKTISSAKITVRPKSTSISKLSAGKKKIKVKWKKASGLSGYQVQYSTSSKFKSGNKTVSVSSGNTTSKTLTKLKAKKKYYVRIRTYKVIDGKKVYSSWSKTKTIKTK